MNNWFKKLKRQLFYLSILKFKKNESVIRWGIVGVGHMAHEFGFAISSSKTSLISAVSGRREERVRKFSRRFNIHRSFKSYREMIDNSSGLFDILYVATPVETHYEIVKYAIEKGIRVLCEKPITSNLGELKELLLIAKERKVFLMEAMWMSTLPTMQKAKELVRSGIIGELKHLIINFNKMNHYEALVEIDGKPKYKGVLLDYGNYCIAFAQAFMPSAFMDIENAHSRKNGDIDFDWSLVLVSDKVKSYINISSSFETDSKAVVIGSKGRIQWESQFNRTDRIILFDQFGNRIKKYKFSYKNNGFEFQLKEVERCILHNSIESDIIPLSNSEQRMEFITRLKLG